MTNEKSQLTNGKFFLRPTYCKIRLSPHQYKTRGLQDCNPLESFKVPLALEAQSGSEPEDTFVNAFTTKGTRARDFHKAIQPQEAGHRIGQNIAIGVTRRRRDIT